MAGCSLPGASSVELVQGNSFWEFAQMKKKNNIKAGGAYL